MRTTKRSKFVALAVGLALVAAACGDDKESTTTNAPETTAGEVTETTAGEVTETTAGEVTETTVADTAVWEDGSEIGLADFQCTQDAIMNTPGSLSTTGYDQVIGIAEGATPKDIVVTLKSQYAPWKGLFSGLLKAANFEDCNDVSESFDAGIPFSGREWQIDSWSAEQLVLVPNPGYTGSKVPGVERIVVEEGRATGDPFS